MLFNKVILGVLSLSLILAHPLMERREDENRKVLARAPKIPTKAIAAVAKPLAKAATKPPPKPAPKPPARAAPKPRARAAPKPPAKAASKPAPKPPARAAPKSPARAAPKPPAKAAPKPPARAAAKSASKPAAKPPARAAAAKSAAKPAAKPPAKGPAKPPPKGGSKAPPGLVLYTGNSYVDQARKANNAPGRQVPKGCKKVSDCSCPKSQSTSCINGACSCNNAGANFFAKEAMNVAKAVGNAPIVQGIGQTFKVLADIKQVAGTVAGTFLGPVGKAAVKVGMLAAPDLGPSHIDDVTNGVLNKLPL